MDSIKNNQKIKTKKQAPADDTGAVFTNGKIFTSRDDMPYADTMMVERGYIKWIGRQTDMPQTDLPQIDLMGKRIIPGLVDAHIHVAMLARASAQLSCLPPKIRSMDQMIDAIKGIREKQGPDGWIEGWGYDEGKMKEGRLPLRYDLDSGCSDAPVVITRTCAHIKCVNTRALQLAGIDRTTPDPQGGEIDRDGNGDPTGILRENARNLITDIMPQPTEDELISSFIELGTLLASQGITSVADMGDLNGENHYDHFLKAAERGMRQQMACYYMWEYFAEDSSLIPLSNRGEDQQICFAGLKLIGDGSISGKTAWMDQPYLGSGQEVGMPVCSDVLLESAIDFCKKNKCQLSMHAMGSRAIDRIADRVCREEKWTDGRLPAVRIEHVTEPSDRALKQMADGRIAVVTQPIFLYSEIECYLQNLGEARMKKTYPIKTMLDRGIAVALSTDAPATSWAVPSDPMICIKAAVTRTAYDGTDCGPAERIEIETALKLYTRYAAEISGFTRTGQLKEGYRADFLVLDRDILEVPASEIDQVAVEKTYISGELVWGLKG